MVSTTRMRHLMLRFVIYTAGKVIVTSVLPIGGQELKGDEIDKIITFKSALGIDHPDAASMHMEIHRQGLEIRDRDGSAAQHQAFIKLIYALSLVFGEASSFLLPWKHVFKVTDAQSFRRKKHCNIFWNGARRSWG